MRPVIAYVSLIGLAGVFLWILTEIWIHDTFCLYEFSIPIRIIDTVLVSGALILGIERFISECRKP